jgi:tRNA G18 (ribose-2'-O)-methylase SpoU
MILFASLVAMKYVILHDIRSNYNVGAIFRTADAAGVAKIFLTGYTPTPIDRFGRPVPEIHKTALGAEETISWEKVDIQVLIPQLQEVGVTVVAVEQRADSVDLYDFSVPPKVAYIFGSETEGLNSEILDACDEVLELPMKGTKESLNVSVTAGIVMYHT